MWNFTTENVYVFKIQAMLFAIIITSLMFPTLVGWILAGIIVACSIVVALALVAMGLQRLVWFIGEHK